MLKLVWPGDVLTCRGVVIDKRKESGEHVIDADVWADNQRGETVAKGRVLAVVPATSKKGLTAKEKNNGAVYLAAAGKSRSSGAKKTARVTKVSARISKTTKKTSKKKR